MPRCADCIHLTLRPELPQNDCDVIEEGGDDDTDNWVWEHWGGDDVDQDPICPRFARRSEER